MADQPLIRWPQDWVILWRIFFPITSALQSVWTVILRRWFHILCLSDHPLDLFFQGLCSYLKSFVQLIMSKYLLNTYYKHASCWGNGKERGIIPPLAMHARERNINESLLYNAWNATRETLARNTGKLKMKCLIENMTFELNFNDLSS